MPEKMLFDAIERDCSSLKDVKLSLPPLASELLDISYSDELDKFECFAPGLNLPYNSSDLFYASIQNHRKLTNSEDVKPVYEVTFNVRGVELMFEAGDAVGIIPKNSNIEVESLLKILMLDNNAKMRYTLKEKPNMSAPNLKKLKTLMNYIPMNGTLESLFSNNINIRAVVKKVMLRSLSIYCTVEKEKICMEILSSKEGNHLYNRLILQNNTSLLDILDTFQSCKPPVTVILQNLPQLLPRPYSICSSRLFKENEIKICYAVQKNIHGLKGVATGWMETLLEDENGNLDKFSKLTIKESAHIFMVNSTKCVPMYLRNPTAFRLPDNEAPLLMVCAGTGISPFIGFLREKKMRIKKNAELSTGEMYLFYGCRYKDRDFLYKDELSDFLKDGILTKLVVAFSRDEKGNYIQDELKSEAKLILKIIEAGGTIYVCSNRVSMENAVRREIETAIATVRNCTANESKDLVTKLQAERRYVVEVWS